MDDSLTVAEWVFGIAGVLGSLASLLAIGFALVSLKEAKRLRRAAIRETRLERAERRLGALEQIAFGIEEMRLQASIGNPIQLAGQRRELRLEGRRPLITTPIKVACDAQCWESD